MSHFYGTIQGNKGEATRCGSQGSGMTTHCAGWGGCIRAEAFHHDGEDMYRVYLTPWQSSGGSSVLLSSGRLKSDLKRDGAVITPWAKELFDGWLPQVDNMDTLDWMQTKIAHAYLRIGT